MTTMLYRQVYAPNGKIFEEPSALYRRLQYEGWVDNPAKITPNPSNTSEVQTNELFDQYFSGVIPGIDEFDESLGNPRCPIWKTVVYTYPPERYVGYVTIDSPRAGGKYAMNEQAIYALSQCDEACKARLTTWLVKQRRIGDKFPKITGSVIEDMEQKEDLQIYDRSNLLLQFISNQTPKIGDEISFSHQNVSTLALAWSESTNFSEVQVLLKFLVDQGFLHKARSESDEYSLTVSGIAKLEEFKTNTVDSSQAFVAMWFHDSMNVAWEQGIKPGIEHAGYNPIRIDEKEHIGKIDDEIIAEIKRSRFVVVDFTQGGEGARGSVYYEAGFAHGLNIPVIFTCRKDVLKKVHFDTRQYNHIVWETAEELRQGLANRISALIGDGPNK